MKTKKPEKPELKDWRDEFKPLIFPLVTRVGWAAVHPISVDTPIQHPIRYVVCSFIRVTEGGIPEKVVIQQMQHRDMNENGLSDIQCNFVIDARGTIYEGRGWDTQPGRSFYYPGYEGQFIEIAYIGDFSGDLPQITTKELLKVGKKYKFLAKDFEFLKPEQRRKDIIP